MCACVCRKACIIINDSLICRFPTWELCISQQLYKLLVPVKMIIAILGVTVGRSAGYNCALYT